MPAMCEHRANAGTVVIGEYLYAFGGFQTQAYGQVGVDSFERIHLTQPGATWHIVEFSTDSIDLGKIACFYLSDITDYLKANPDPQSLQKKDANGELEQAIMLIGGWSKTSYLTELNLFYPNQNKLARWGNSVRL